MGVISQAPELLECEIGITLFGYPRDNTLLRSQQSKAPTSTGDCTPLPALAITDEASRSALRSTRNCPRTAVHQGCHYCRERTPLLVTRGDHSRSSVCFSVSNLSARLPCDTRRSRTSPRPVTADELRCCGAEHGARGRYVGAALASHGRSHRFDPCHAHHAFLQVTPVARLTLIGCRGPSLRFGAHLGHVASAVAMYRGVSQTPTTGS
jgi:hypothetical protein